MRRIFELTGVIENGRVVLIGRNGKRIATVPVALVDGECNPDGEVATYEWRKVANELASSLDAHEAHHLRRGDSSSEWERRCESLRQSWNRRPDAIDGRATPTTKNPRTKWGAACRQMHINHLKKIERVAMVHDWASWANNASSNQLKRLRWLKHAGKR